MSKHAYPEFHKALLEQATYPAAPRRIRFEETRRSYLYRTGEHLYKLRKASPLYSSPAIRERYAQVALSLGQRWARDVVQAVVPILRTPGGYALTGEGEAVDYALRMVQLPDSHWLHRMLEHGKVTPTHVGRLARFLAEQHAAAALGEKAAEMGHPHRLQALFDELIYQSKKHFGQTLSEPVLDMIVRPLSKYLDEVHKLLVRRLKRGRIVEGHGAPVPEHFCLQGDDVHALAPLDAQPKFRQLDAANDVAVLINALESRGQGEHAELLVKRYVAAAKDRDLPRVLPLYCVLQALRDGLQRSEWVAELSPDSAERPELARQATAAYNQALRVARALPKLI